MAFVVETASTLEAVEERLTAAVAARQQAPLDRINVLVGSNLQRIYFRRCIAAYLDFSANVRFFTPVDLADAIRQQASLPPRQPLPDGAEPILLDGILHNLREERRLRRLNPEIQGVASSVSGSLTDLREARLTPETYRDLVDTTDDLKLHDLGLIFERFAERMRPFQDRTGTYLDALDPLIPDSAVAGALGDGPLLVVGLYDAPAVQIALIARCAAVADTRVFVVAPGDDEFLFARRFQSALVEAGATAAPQLQIEPDFANDLGTEFGDQSSRWYFSAPTRQAEAEEVVRRALWLARDHGVRFDQMAVLHRLDHSADDVLSAAFARAGIPSYRAAGRPLRHTAAGQAALVLLDLMLRPPERHRLLEFVGSPSLRETLPSGARPTPLLWERISKQAGMVSGWDRFLDQLQKHRDDRQRGDHLSTEFIVATIGELHGVVADLAERVSAREDLATWSQYTEWFLEVLDSYLQPPRKDPADEIEDQSQPERDPAITLRDRIQALAHLDQTGVAVEPERFRIAAEQAIRRAVINDRRPLTRGVFIGNVGAARSLRFEAVFLVECAERIFPPLIRQDPLLLDTERERLNQRAQRSVLPLKRDRLLEEEMLFQLVTQSARRFLTLSWARRTNATGAPRLPSSYLLRSLPPGVDELARLDHLYDQGVIEKMPTRLAGAAPMPASIEAGDWSRTATALDASDFRLAILEAAPHAARDLLPQLWPGHSRWRLAREGRANPNFGAWDGIIDPDQFVDDPLSRQTSPTALETYATCPYRYFVRQMLHVHAVPEPGEALEMSPLDRGNMVHRILEDWVREGQASGDWLAFVQNGDRLLAIAESEFERSGKSGLAGLPVTWSLVQGEIIQDLKHLRELEQDRARGGYQPIAVERAFGGQNPIELGLRDGTTLRLGGRIDRIDQGPDGLVAIDYKTGRASKDAGAYRSGQALQLPIYIQAVAGEMAEPTDRISAEYFYATHKGNFQRSTINGADVFADEVFWDTLETITGGVRAGRFPPYPGDAKGNRPRPNCQFCDYVDLCTTDVDKRFNFKASRDQDTVREFLILQARR
jgi:RecB family exonuclease